MRATTVWDPGAIAYVTLCLLVFAGILGRTYFRGWLGRKTARSWPSREATVQSTGVSVCVEGNVPEEIIDIQSAGVDAFWPKGAEAPPGHRGKIQKVWFVRASYSFIAGGEYYGGYADRQVSSEQAGAA